MTSACYPTFQINFFRGSTWMTPSLFGQTKPVKRAAGAGKEALGLGQKIAFRSWKLRMSCMTLASYLTSLEPVSSSVNWFDLDDRVLL